MFLISLTLSLFVCISCIDLFFFFKQKTAYELRISDWSSDVCSSDLDIAAGTGTDHQHVIIIVSHHSLRFEPRRRDIGPGRADTKQDEAHHEKARRQDRKSVV